MWQNFMNCLQQSSEEKNIINFFNHVITKWYQYLTIFEVSPIIYKNNIA